MSLEANRVVLTGLCTNMNQFFIPFVNFLLNIALLDNQKFSELWAPNWVFQVLQLDLNLDFSTGRAPPWTGSMNSANNITIAANTKFVIVVAFLVIVALFLSEFRWPTEREWPLRESFNNWACAGQREATCRCLIRRSRLFSPSYLHSPSGVEGWANLGK